MLNQYESTCNCAFEKLLILCRYLLQKMAAKVEPLVSGSVIGAQLFNRLVWGIQGMGEDGTGE